MAQELDLSRVDEDVDGVSGDVDGVALDSDEGTELTQETIDVVRGLAQSLLDAGLVEGLERTEDREKLASLAKEISGIAVKTHEVGEALREQDNIQRRAIDSLKPISLAKQDLPYGSRQMIHAADRAPVARAAHFGDVQRATFALCEGLDTKAALLEGRDAEVEAAEVDDQISQSIKVLRKAGKEPRKAAYTLARRNAWLSIEYQNLGLSDAVQRRNAIRMAKNICLKYEAELEKLARHHSSPRKNPRPPLKPLLKAVSDLERISGKRAERIVELFDKDERDSIKLLVPAIVEHVEEARRALSGHIPKRPLTVEENDYADQLKDAKNMGAVYRIAKSMGPGLSQIFTLHWVVEAIVDELYNSNVAREFPHKFGGERRWKFFRGDRKGHAVNATVGHWVKELVEHHISKLSQLRSAITFRNNICHQGRMWEVEQFPDAAKKYCAGIDRLCSRFGLDLGKTKVRRVNIFYSVDELRAQFDQICIGKNMDPQLFAVHVPDLNDKLAKYCWHNNPKLWGIFLLEARRDFARELLGSDKEADAFLQELSNSNDFPKVVSEKYGGSAKKVNFTCTSRFSLSQQERDDANRNLKQYKMGIRG